MPKSKTKIPQQTENLPIKIRLLNSFLKNKILIALLCILLIGLILRTANLIGNINFHYDQGRDAQRIYNIVHNGDFKIVGPETDIPGVFNGPIYYYLLAPLYALGEFDPNFVAFFFILFNMSGAILLYYFAKVLFNNKSIGLIAAFLWSISYEQAVFSRYISNASGMSLATMLFFLGLALHIFKSNKWGLTMSVVGLGLAIHFNFYLIYLGGFYLIYYFVFRPSISIKSLLLNGTLLFFLISNFFLTELMWNFATTKALLSYFSGQSDHTFSLLSHLSLYQDKLVEMIKYSFFSYQPILALLLFVSFVGIAIKYQKPRREVLFLLIWVFSNAPLFIFRSGVLTVPVISTTIFGAVTLLFAVGIYQIYHTRFKYISIILVLVFLISNIQLLIREQFRSVNLLSAIPLLLKDERSVIDYTYQSSAGKPFSICALTNPLFVNSTWSFLYTVYGKKYNFTPYWSGQPQYINKGMLPYDTQKVEIRYLILEPLVGIPEEALKATVYMEDQVSEIVQEKKFGTLTVQKRKLNPAINGVRDSQNLSEEEARGVKGRIGNDPRYSCFMDYDL